MKVFSRSFFLVIFFSFCFELITGFKELWDLEFDKQVLFFVVLFLIGFISVFGKKITYFFSILSVSLISMLGAFAGQLIFFIIRSEFDALLIIGLIYFFVFSFLVFAGSFLYLISSFAFFSRK